MAAGSADKANSCCGPDQGCAPQTGVYYSYRRHCVARYICCEDDDGDSYCAPQGRGGTVRADGCLDTVTMDFEQYPSMDWIFENMCRGMKLRGWLGNEMYLTYIGGGDRRQGQNRVAAGCNGRNALRCVLLFGPGWACDEWPPASSVEGGANSAI